MESNSTPRPGEEKPLTKDQIAQEYAKKRAAFLKKKPARSLLCLTLNNPIRRLAYALLDWKGFEFIILVTILATCVCLAAASPYPNDDSDGLNESLEEVEIVFTVIFTTECALKIIAQGLIAHEGAYLRGGLWNLLDFTIVGIGLLEPIIAAVMGGGVDVKALRAFRVLRPLKLVSGVPALQIVMNAILMAMIPLFQIFLLAMFVIVIYAIVGLEMYGGQLHQSCFHSRTGEMMKDPVNCGGGYNCEDEGEEYTCRIYWEGPDNGITNFDNIGLAMLTVYNCIAFAGWSTIMYHLQDAIGSGFEWVYFTTLCVFGAFMVMNLVLGVLSGEFGKQKEKAESRGLYLKMKEEGQVEAAFTKYLDWITKVEDSIKKKQGENGILLGESGESEETKASTNPFCKGCAKANGKLTEFCITLIKSEGFYWTIIVLVFLNTAVLATEHHNQPQWLTDFQEFVNIFFVGLFILEMLLKMYALGLPKYFQSLFNRFDFFATIASILEVVLAREEIMPPMGVSVLRCVRLLRVFKITRYWTAMKLLVSGILDSLQSIAALLLLLFLFMMIFALLGMQLFGGKFSNIPPTEYKARTNFDSFRQSLLTVFQILTGEDWTVVMLLGLNAADSTKSFLITLVYFLVLFTLGNYILLNVFLAIAVDGLELAEEEVEVEKEEDAEPPAVEEEKAEEVPKTADGNEKASESGTEKVDEAVAENAAESNAEKAGESKPEKTADDAATTEGGGEEPAGESEEEPAAEPPNPPIPAGSSFFILSQTNPFRVFMYKAICHPIVCNFLLVCILISSGAMAAEDPVYDDSARNKMLEEWDKFFTAIFTVELCSKLLVYGLIFHQGAFLRAPANLLDFVVVGVSLLSMFSSGGAVSTIKILRVARVLRPLRAINRAKGLKRVIQCMIVSIKTIFNIIVVSTLVIFMYSVIGVQLFKGALYQCTDPAMKVPEQCKGTFIDYDEGDINKPIVRDREWENSFLNYDSVPNGMLTLFVVSTFASWPDMLYMSIDTHAVDKGPKHDNRMMVAMFYITFLIILSLFMINIFVGFVILTFVSEGEKEYEHCDMEKNQRDCIRYALDAKPMRKYIPANRFQYKLWLILTSENFENLSLGLIILNTISLGMKFYNQPDWYTEFLDQANIFFTIVFTIEFFFKLTAFGVVVYLRDAWNVFDFLLVVGSYVDILFADVNIGVLKLFRVGRLVKLLNKSKDLRSLLFTFVKSFQALPYVLMLMMLVFFIYSIIGMQTFGKIALDGGTEIHRNNNFQSFGNTLLLLFRTATGEGWNGIMESCAATKDVKCFFPPEEEPEDGEFVTCGSNLSYLYFISFTVMCSFLVLNLFVAVIMDNFEYLTRDWSILGTHLLGEFIELWSEYDPDATGQIRHEDVVKLLRKIDPPLGFGCLCPRRTACKRLVAMNMPMNADSTVDFNATLFALVRVGLQIRTEGNIQEADEDLRKTILALWPNTNMQMLDKVVPPPHLPTDESSSVGKFYACMLIQEHFRKYKKRIRGKLMAQKKAGENGNGKASILKVSSDGKYEELKDESAEKPEKDAADNLEPNPECSNGQAMDDDVVDTDEYLYRPRRKYVHYADDEDLINFI